MIDRHPGPDRTISFDLTHGPGTYVLILQTFWESIIDVGRLGELSFPAGRYLYVGSALGPGGLSARISHHARFADPPKWHIDHLRLAASPVEVWYCISNARLEHEWAVLLASIEGVEEGAAGFGSSDCRCRTHLFRCEDPGLFDVFGVLTSVDLQRSAAVRIDG